MDNTAKIFDALASTARRKILAYLSKTEMSAGEICDRFEMSRPALSKHLKILENADLVSSSKRGQFVYYSIVEENIANSLLGFVSTLCPTSTQLKKESTEKAKAKK
ncbi:MAG: ArsR/SmtB family transcription factor [Arenicella sp.]